MRIPLFVLAFLLPASPAMADLFKYTTATDPSNATDANKFVNNVAAGTTNVWNTSFSTGNTSQAGSFADDSAANGDGNGGGAGNPAWALYANSGQTASATASITSLVGRAIKFNGESVSLDFDNGFIDNTGVVGVSFLNASNMAVSTFQFTGGQTSYRIFDSVSNFETGIGFTDDGFNVKLDLIGGAGGYTLTADGNVFAGRQLASGVSIAGIRVFNNNAGSFAQRDFYFNNVTISAVPEPSSIALLAVVGIGSGAWVRFRRSKKVADVPGIATEETVA